MIDQFLLYFKSAGTVYNSTKRLLSLLESVYTLLIKKFDCDTYYPTSIEVLDYVKNNNVDLYKELQNFAIESKMTLDLKISNNLKVDINSFSDIDKKNIDDYFYKDIEVKNKIKCQEIEPNPFRPDFSLSLDDVEVLKDALEQTIINDNYKEFIDRCRERKNVIKDIEEDKYSSEEVAKLIDDCFEPKEFENDYVQPENFNLPNEDPFQSNIVTSDFSFTPSPFSEIKTLLPDNICIQLTEEFFTKISDLNKKYIDVSIKKIEIEKTYAYASLMYNFYDRLERIWGNFPSTISKNSSTLSNPLSIKKYSNEIIFKTRKINSYTIINNYFIKFKSSPKKKDGEYFSLYDFLEDDPIMKKLKEGKGTEKDGIEVDNKIKKEFEKDLKKRVKSARNDAEYAYLNMFIDLNPLDLAQKIIDIKSIKNDLRSIKAKFQVKYETARKEYLNYYKVKDEVLSQIDVLTKQYENDLLLNKCTVNRFSQIEVLEPEEDEEFKEIPNGLNPTINDKKYWERFATLATQIGLLPLPQFTGSNDIKVNMSNYRNPAVTLPSGGVAIDDDGIPRFLFWPIGFLIPTPLSIDGLYRIPFPSYFKYLFHANVENPLDKVTAELLKINSQISCFTEEHRSTLRNVGKAAFLANLPNANILTLMTICGIANQAPFNIVNDYVTNKLKGVESYIKSMLARSIADVQTGRVPSDAYVIKNRLNDNIDKIVAEAQRFINIQVKDIKEFIEKNIPNVDFTKADGEITKYINLAQSYIDTINTILSIVNTKCVGMDMPDFYNRTIEYSTDALNSARNLSNEAQKYTNMLRNFDLILPDFPFEDILFSGLQDILQIFYNSANELAEEVNLDEVFPKLKLFIDDIQLFINNFIFKFYKLALFNAPIDLESLMSFNIPREIISSLSVATIDFPQLTFVGFLAQTGIFTFPIVLVINNGNAPVPGLVDARSISMITVDITGLIKSVKQNHGSYILPLSTYLETFLNESLGVRLNSRNNTIESTCDLYSNLKQSSAALLNQYKFKFTNPKYKLKDIYNLIEVPNPSSLCLKANANNMGDYLEKIFSEIKLKTNSLPGSFSKLQEVAKYGIFDLDGEFIIDEFKAVFNVDGFPKLRDVLELDQSQLEYISLNQMGLSQKVLTDIFPQLTKTTIFLQDDLPPWERLHLKNIPFDFFLFEFLIAAKKGNVIPIAEVFPYLKM